MSTLGKHWMHSEAYKKKMSEVKKKQYQDGLVPHNKSKTKADYLPLQVVSEKMTGWERTPEHNKKISIKAKERMQSEYYKAMSRKGAYVTRSKHLFKSTKLEIKVENILKALQIQYTPQYMIRDELGRYLTISDFYISYMNLCIYAHGCYWHNCQGCGYKYDGERHRKDKKAQGVLNERDLYVLILWEHESEDSMRNKLVKALEKYSWVGCRD